MTLPEGPVTPPAVGDSIVGAPMTGAPASGETCPATLNVTLARFPFLPAESVPCTVIECPPGP